MTLLEAPNKVRLNHMGPIEQCLSPLVKATLNAYWTLTQEMNGSIRSFQVDAMPISLNHQYEGTGKGKRLVKGQKEFREILWASLPPNVRQWKPHGVLGCVILFMSNTWVTQEHTIRTADVDNRIKPVLDAIEIAIGIQDQRYWAVAAHKVASKRERTIVYLYSLGDIVSHHP